MAIGSVLKATWRFVPDRSGMPWSYDSFLTDAFAGHIDDIGSGRKGGYEAFDVYTWLFLFSSIPVSGVVLYVSRRFGMNPDKEANIWQCMWECVIIICWESITIRYELWPVVLPCIRWLHVYVVHCYFGVFRKYTAIIIIPRYKTQKSKSDFSVHHL